jgi:hypothetical protein
MGIAEGIAVAVALVSAALCLLLASMVRGLRSRVEALEAQLATSARQPLPGPEALSQSPLEGLRIAVRVQQDHSRPTFSNLLAQRLEEENAEVRLVDAEHEGSSDWDLEISGSITCSGESCGT